VQAEREKIESRGKPVGKMKSEERLKGDGRKGEEEKGRKRGSRWLDANQLRM